MNYSLHHITVVEAGEQGQANHAGACIPRHGRLINLHLPSNELREDAASSPHVHGTGVVLAAHEELRRPVGSRHHVVREVDVKVLHPLPARANHGLAGYAEVTDLEVPQAIEEEVGGFDVAMNDLTVVKVRKGSQELKHDTSHLLVSEDAIRVHELRQVRHHEVSDEVHVCHVPLALQGLVEDLAVSDDGVGD